MGINDGELSHRHAPSGTDGVVDVSSLSSYTVSASDFGFTDPLDTPSDALHRVKIDTLPASGSLELAGAPVEAGQFVSVEDINAGNLQFLPASGVGVAIHPRMTFQVEDDATGLGGGYNLDLSPNTLVFSLGANTAPTAVDDTYSVQESGVSDQLLVATRVWMNSAPGDLIGGGTSRSIDDAEYTFSAATNEQNGVTITSQKPISDNITLLGPTLSFATADGSPLTVGTYENTQDIYSTSTGRPVMSVTPSPFTMNDWGDLTGSFTVNEVTYGNNGQLLSFDATFTEYAANSNPTTAALTGRVQYHVGQPASVSVLQNDTDADSDPLAAVLVAGPSHGTLSLRSDGGFSYTPTPGYSGVDSFQYKANDGIADSNVATVKINVESFGHAPTGASQTVNAAEGASYALKAADFGFSDPNDTPGDAFTAVKITTLPTDAVLTLSGIAVTEGQLVSVADIEAGNLVLTPGARNHRVGFTFQVQDSTETTFGGENLDSDPKTLTLNFAPVAANDSYVVFENQTLDQAFLGNHYRVNTSFTTTTTTPSYVPGIPDQVSTTFPTLSQSDFDGSGGLCTVMMNGNGARFTFGSLDLLNGPNYVQLAAAGDARLTPGVYTDVLSVADDSHASLNIGGIMFANTTREFEITEVEYNDAGVIVRMDMTYHIVTNNGFTNIQTGVTTTNTNDIVGHLQYNATAKSGTSVLANDSDPDGDTLSLLSLPITLAQGGVITVVMSQIDIITQPEHGSLTLYRDGGFIYKPNQNYSGSDSFQYRVNDGSANSNVATVSIDVQPVSSAPEGADKVLNYWARDVYVIQEADFGFADPHDTPADSFTGAVITTLPETGVLKLGEVPVVAGQFVSIEDIALGLLNYTPAETSTPGTHASFTFQVQDSGTLDNGGATIDSTPNTFTFNSIPYSSDDYLSQEAAFDWHLTIDSQAGDPVGDGNHYDVNSANGKFLAGTSPDSGAIHLGFLGSTPNGSWNLFFEVPHATYIVPGVYNCTDRLENPDSPAFAINKIGQLMLPPTGTFTVLKAVYSPTGEVLEFDATFTQYADGASAPLTGRIQYHIPKAIVVNPLANDVDLDGDTLTVHIVTPPQFGTATVNGDGSITYTPNPDFFGAELIQYRTNDGMTDGNVSSALIEVWRKSAAPSGTSQTINFASGSGYAIKSTDFGFTDPGDLPQDTLVGVVITTLPTLGSLELAGTPVTAGDFILVEDIDAGYLIYTPPIDPLSKVHDSLTFQVQDSGRIDNNGEVLDPIAKTMTFNRLPVAADDSFTIEPTETVLNVLANDSDMDDDLLFIYPVSDPSHGSLIWSFMRPQQIAYVPNPGYVGSDTFQYRIGDGYGSSQYATVTVNVRPAKPTISIDDVSKAEGNDGTTTYTFTVSLSNAYDEDVSVDYATANDTAVAGSDYQSLSGTLTWTAGDSTSKTIAITVTGDAAPEADETFLVNLLNPSSNATLTKSQGTGTILDDDINHSPTIDNVIVPSSPVVGMVTIHYTLHDRESDPCDILVETSYDGVHWNRIKSMITGEDTTNLASSPEGVEHSFQWYGGLFFAGAIIDRMPYPTYTYQYTVKFRITPSDASSTGTAVVTDLVTVVDSLDDAPPTPNPSGWDYAPHATGPTSISMTARTARDIHGVQYYFHCLTDGGHDSGWQDSATYVDTGLIANTQYAYEVKTRDKYITPNEGDYSASASATTLPSTAVLNTVNGTSGNDVFEFHAGASASDWIVMVNGIRQTIPTGTTNLMFDGQGGVDRFHFFGNASALNAELWYSQGGIHFADFAVDYVHMENVAVTGASGKDAVMLHDSSGNDEFVSLPGSANLTCGSLSIVVDRVATVNAASSDGNDTATLFDGTDNASTLVAGPTDVDYTGAGFVRKASGFDAVHVYATPGKNNSAQFNGSDGADIFIASYLGAQFIAPRYAYDAWNFSMIQGLGGKGDEARFYGSPGGNTTLSASPSQAGQTEGKFIFVATGYSTVASYVYPGGNTTATLVGGLDADNAVASQHGAQMFNDNYELSAWNYRRINLVANGDNDIANLYATNLASNFVGIGSDATMTFGNVERKVTNFSQAIAHGNAASTATFYGIAGGTNTFDVAPAQASMSGANYKNVAMGFGSSMGVGSPDAVDVVNYTDSAGDDMLLASYLGSTMFGNGFSNSAWHFDKVNATSASGNDTARFYGSSASPDTFTASPRSAKHVGNGFENHADGFAVIEAYSGLGSGGAASLTGSTGDDVCVTSPLGVQLWNSNYRIEAWNYASTKTVGNGGTDTADFYGKPANNHLAADKIFAEFSGTGFDNRVENFATVRVHGSTIGKDAAELDHAYLETNLKETPDHPGDLSIVRKLWLYDFDEIATTEKPSKPTPTPINVDKWMTAFMYE
jgi:hypothetical protein